ncbi:MAG TPA: UbiA family prenyltransferase [Planctomicrobium sp.]|nr:UbiA family prenyltransferase [Planctomicrobium sp.]
MSTSIHSLLRLCRLPTVFTALADICAGYLLTHRTWEPVGTFAALLVASAGLYLSGMVFNDIFDRTIDQQERPRRPIPSGAVSLKTAILFGVILMTIGLGAAAVAGKFSFLVAVAIAVAVFLYDGILKRTPVGPISMGTCRFLNILLGASAAATQLSDLWALPQIWFAAAMGVYITGVTWFAKKEARKTDWSALLPGLILVDLGLLMLAAWIGELLPDWGIAMPAAAFQPPQAMLFLLGAIALTINRRAVVALGQPEPALVQMTVGAMLLSIISINAMVIYFYRGQEALPFAIATLVLILPALLLRRWIPLT